MVRRLLTVLCSVALLGAASSLTAPGAQAAPSARFYGLIVQETSTCSAQPFWYECHVVGTGYAIRSDNVRFSLTIHEHTFNTHACLNDSLDGTWSLHRANTADGLTGTFPFQYADSPHRTMKVNSGTGAYAGLTDATDGTEQDFGPIMTPQIIVAGIDVIGTLLTTTISCKPYAVLGHDHGRLSFNLVPA